MFLIRRAACTSALVVSLFLVPLWATSARADLAQKPGTAGCVTETGNEGECQDGRGLVGTLSVALSSDGDNAYVASANWSSLSILTRSPATGDVTPIPSKAGCFFTLSREYRDCGEARALGGADDVVVSPDGKSVYVAAPAESSIAVFSRNPATGELSQSSSPSGCVAAEGNGGCTPARAIDRVTALAISPDGSTLYAASPGLAGGIAVFDRDPLSGDLTQEPGSAGCVNQTGEEGCAVGLNQVVGSHGVAVSADGQFVYAVSASRNAVTVYRRDPEGGLTPLSLPAGCVRWEGGEGCGGASAMIAPRSIAISPDGGSAYVAGERSDAIVVFSRDPETGALAQLPGTAGCISDTGFSNPMQAGTENACQDGSAMDGIDSIAVAPDGGSVYATAVNSSSVTIYERHPDATLSQLAGPAGCITETGFETTSLFWTAGYCADGSALQNASNIIVSSDGRFAYTAAEYGGLGAFDVVQGSSPTPPVQSSAAPAPTSDTSGCGDAKVSLGRAMRGVRLARQTVQLRRMALLGGNTRKERVHLKHALRADRRKLRLWLTRETKAAHAVTALCH